MKTSNKTRTAEEQNQQRPQPTQPDNSTAKSRKTRKWLTVVEFAFVNFATWLNPEAGFLIFLLKLCFQILKQLQDKPEQ